jgi:hypothetical protein
MHGQRDLLDWQDESKKEGMERERPAKLSKHEERGCLGMVSGVGRNNGMRVGEYLL